MEENKNNQHEQSGRKRRRKHKGGKNNRPNNNNNNNNNGQPQQAQSVQPSQAQQVMAKTLTAQPQHQAQQPKQNAQKQNKKKQKQQNKQADDGRKDTYAYTLDGNLYLNLTNKCSNGCDFCVRNERTSYYGNYLWLRHGDPSAEKVISALNGFGDLTKFKEAVFCGFGEPTYKMTEMLALCDYFHEKGLKTRLNTNGQGALINKRDIVPELKGKIDFVNISLNASCAEKYQKICRSQYGESGFEAMVEFGKSCRRNGIACRFSIVDCIGEEEVEACKRLAQSVNVPLYIRNYITDS